MEALAAHLSATLTVPEVASLLDCSNWAVYEALKRKDFPIAPIRVGRRILFPKARVFALLGLSEPNVSQRNLDEYIERNRIEAVNR